MLSSNQYAFVERIIFNSEGHFIKILQEFGRKCSHTQQYGKQIHSNSSGSSMRGHESSGMLPSSVAAGSSVKKHTWNEWLSSDIRSHQNKGVKNSSWIVSN